MPAGAQQTTLPRSPVGRCRREPTARLLLVSLLTVLAGCDPGDTSRLPRPKTDSVRSVVVDARTHDQAITSAVKARLLRDADLGPLGIEVQTAQGRVVLRGSVPNTGLRNRAAELSGAVEGVAAISNELNVQAR